MLLKVRENCFNKIISIGFSISLFNLHIYFFLISGWEVSHDLLHWHKYDQDNQEKKVRMKMSHLSWSEQRIFQQAFNKYGEMTIQSQIPEPTPNKDLASKLVVKNEVSRKFKMVHGLDLLHLGRKRQQNKPGKAKNSSNSQGGSLNGEWERMHDFMCTSCAIGMLFN